MEIAPAGYAKSLVQTGLRCTLPGVPDLFQGCESWDLSLVDPDNRRPVDYSRLVTMLDGPGTSWREGASKQRLIADLLARKPEGALSPVRLVGARAEEALAFRRGELVVVAALRGAEACIARGCPEPGRDWWGDTRLELPEGRVDATEIVGDGSFGTRC